MQIKIVKCIKNPTEMKTKKWNMGQKSLSIRLENLLKNKTIYKKNSSSIKKNLRNKINKAKKTLKFSDV